MFALSRLCFGLLALLILNACGHKDLRQPASVEPTYNPEKVRLLRQAADAGILIQIPDSVLRDIPGRQVGEKCRTTEESPWTRQLFAVLEIFDKQPGLRDRVHVIEFRRGDQPTAEISKDLDGAVTLVVSYVKVETREKIENVDDIPCSQGDADLIGKELTVTSFAWPQNNQLANALRGLDSRPTVDRFQFDRKFVIWLADHLAFFRLTPDLAFEKTPTGEPLLPYVMTELSRQVSTGATVAHVAYWYREISLKSKLGGGVKFFGLKRDLSLSHGLQVDSAGQFARKMNGFHDPTYPYLSYRVDNNAYSMVGLGQLNSCLQKLMDIYRSPLSSMTTFELDPGSFMYPGHHCVVVDSAD